MKLWHLLDECVGDWVPHRVTLNVLRVELTEDLELLLDQLSSFDLLSFCRGQDMLRLDSLTLLSLKSGLSE